MKLITFRQSYEGLADARAGVLLPFGVVDLQAAAPLVYEGWEDKRLDMLTLLDGDEDGFGLDAANQIVNAVLEQIGGSVSVVSDENEPDVVDLAGTMSIGGAELLLPRSAVNILPALPRPRSLRLFASSESHLMTLYASLGRPLPSEWSEEPAFEWGNHQAIVGHRDEITLPRTAELDYGLAVAAVIGREGMGIPAEVVWDYIAGFVLVNDYVARDRQRDAIRSGLGSGSFRDFATAIGPTIVTPDELEDYITNDGTNYQLTLTGRINGRLLTEARLDDMRFSWGQLVARASRDTTLYPGDLLASGTIAPGSIMDLTAEKVGGWLEPDDIVEVEATGLGTLRNRIVY